MVHRIAVFPGDGIGPEVMGQALRVLDAAAGASGLAFETVRFMSSQGFLKRTGKLWEEGSFEFCRDEADAVLLSAVGLPGIKAQKGRMASIVLGLRAGLDLFANVRPIRALPNIPLRLPGRCKEVWDPKHVDLVIIRENTEGLYHSRMQEMLDGEAALSYGPDEAIDMRKITRRRAERVIRFAFEVSRSRNGAPLDGRRRVTDVDKSNVLEGCRLFRTVFDGIASEYSDIEAEHALIDSFQPSMLSDPGRLDVVVTTNMFGDIISDLASLLVGGLGMAPSANIGEARAMFEPVHGSAPDIAGKGTANPTATVLSVGMMLAWLGRSKGDDRATEAGNLVNAAVTGHYLSSPGPKGMTPDLGGTARTSDIGDALVQRIMGS